MPDPNANGWHRAPLTVKFPGTDATSEIANCTPDQSYNGGDTTGTPITGSCTDKAGNTSGAKTYTLKYDATAPALVPDPVPDPNANGWHRAPLTVKFPGSDATSGINACTPDQPYGGPDTGNTPIPGSCTDKAGNQTQHLHAQIRRDEADGLALACAAPNQLGWHKAPLTVTFVGSDAMSGPDQPSCTLKSYSGPDTRARTSPAPAKTSPATPATRARSRSSTTRQNRRPHPRPSPSPNAQGWHKAPLTVTFVVATPCPGRPSLLHGSGLLRARHPGQTIAGPCKDFAGNTSNPGTYTVKYDATVPTLVPDPEPDPNVQGWHRQPLIVKFPGSDATSGIDTCTPDHPYNGGDTTNTPITGSCTDNAGNTSGPKTYTLKYDATAPTLVPDPVPNPNPLGWHRAR